LILGGPQGSLYRREHNGVVESWGWEIHDGATFIILDSVSMILPLADRIQIIDLDKCDSEAEKEPPTEVLFQVIVVFVWGFNNHQTAKSAAMLDMASFSHQEFERNIMITMWKDIADF
jgi:hypothetical protein